MTIVGERAKRSRPSFGFKWIVDFVLHRPKASFEFFKPSGDKHLDRSDPPQVYEIPATILL